VNRPLAVVVVRVCVWLCVCVCAREEGWRCTAREDGREGERARERDGEALSSKRRDADID